VPVGVVVVLAGTVVIAEVYNAEVREISMNIDFILMYI
jgi:uncharacterized Tic20 family protein